MSYLETTSAASSLVHSPSNKIPLQNHGAHDEEDKLKKLNHNASERHRRKKMNSLYATLGSLLPPHHHSKKMSIPDTISRMLKYVPELRNEVERLMLRHKRERFTIKSKINSMPENVIPFKNHITQRSSVSATQISDCEVVIQISMPKTEKGLLSEAISRVEEEGFLMVNASSFQSFQGSLFYNMHFQAQQGQVIDVGDLKAKVWP